MTKSACLAEALCEGRRWAKRFSIRAKRFQGSANFGKIFCELGQVLVTDTVLALEQNPVQPLIRFNAKTRRRKEFLPRMNTDGRGFDLPQGNASRSADNPSKNFWKLSIRLRAWRSGAGKHAGHTARQRITSSGRWRWPLDKDSPPFRWRTILPAA